MSAREFLRFPGTGGGFVLLDVRNPHVLRAGLELLPRGRTLSRVAAGALGLAAHAGLAPWLAAERVRFAVPEVEAGAPLHARFPGLAPDLAWNVASGVPGRDQKLILQLVEPRGAIAAYAKIGRARPSRARVVREARVLARLAALGVPAPRLFGLEHGEHGSMVVVEALEGERGPDRSTAAHAAFLACLERSTARRLPLVELPSHTAARARLARLARGTGAEPRWLAAFEALAAALERRAGDRALDACFAHGDFTPWNTRVRAGELRAFDWEHARPLAPRLHDRLHFVLQVGVLVEHASPARILERIDLELGADAAELEIALAAYIVDVATHDEAIQLEARSPFPQVEWLRAARLELAREITARLGARPARRAA